MTGALELARTKEAESDLETQRPRVRNKYCISFVVSRFGASRNSIGLSSKTLDRVSPPLDAYLGLAPPVRT